MLRRLLPLFLLAGLALLSAQEPAKSETAHEDDNMVWKIVNFAIFAGGIGYAVIKFAPAFFNARSIDIQKAIQDATGLKLQADLRYSEIDRKMANLKGEVDKLRAESKAEMEREHARVQTQTEEDIAYIQKSTAAQIDAMRSEGAGRLRLHATQQAFALAERRLRQQFASSNQQDLLNDFVQLVDRGKN